jgi:hypothetical protein
LGYDAACTIRIEGQTAHGTARLEHKDLIFRGPFRIAVPLNRISRAAAVDGTLVVEYDEGKALELELGEPAAARWSRRITNPPTRLEKLGVKPGMRVALVNLPDRSFCEELVQSGATVVSRASAGTDALFLGASKPADLTRLSGLKALLKPAGALWIVRRKGQTDVSERDSMAAGKRAGLVDVKVVSFSETHTAEKYVIPVAKRARPVRPSSPSRRGRKSASSRGRT